MFPIMWFSLALLSIKNERSGHKASFANAFCLGAGLGITGMNLLAHHLFGLVLLYSLVYIMALPHGLPVLPNQAYPDGSLLLGGFA